MNRTEQTAPQMCFQVKLQITRKWHNKR